MIPGTPTPLRIFFQSSSGRHRPPSGVGCRSRPSEAVAFIEAKGVRVLNVAGYRGSVAPGIGARVERFMRDVFRRLGHAEVE
jgi:hypothetical protein